MPAATSPVARRQAGGSWARQLLASELDEQVLADGMHYERSPAYHCQVLADLIDMRPWLEGDLLAAYPR